MSLTPDNCRILFRKEASFRTSGTSAWLAMDWSNQLKDDFDIAEPELNEEDIRTIGNGRDVSRVITGGFKVGENSVSFDILSGIFLYYAMGTCTTTGTEAPYTHTIAGANTLPSFEMYVSQVFAAETYTTHLKGCLIKSFELSQEVGENTPIQATVDLIVAESSATTLTVTSAALELSRFMFTDVATCSLTYNSGAVAGTATTGGYLRDVANKVVFKIENDIDVKNVLGDNYPKRVIIGGRTITLNTDIEIKNSVINEFRRLKTPSYTNQYNTSGYLVSAIAFQNYIARTATDYIRVDISHLAMDKTLKNKLPSWDSKILELDVPWKGAPGITTTATVMDTLSDAYYEG
jgi:hypothetical protein